MVWQCTACKFSDNESGQDACVACGSKRPEGEEDEPEEEAAGNREDRDDVGIVVIELPGEEKLGVKLIPPVDGVVGHGLAIESINNPLLEDKVQAGDLIVAIGGQDLDGMGFSSAIDLIRKLPRPLGISFEIDALRRQKVAWEKFQASKGNELDTKLSTYTVVFDDGPIGLNLEEGVHHGIDGAIVRALKGQAKSSGMITVGDILYKVNETNVLCMPYMEVMNALRNAPAPKKVQFVPKEKLVDVQRMNFQYSEAFRLHEPTSLASQKLMIPRTVKDKYDRDNWSIAQLILDNKQKAYVEEQEHGRLKELEQLKTQAQMAADEATHYASRAEEEARMKLDQARQKAEAAMIAAQEEQREGKAAVEKAMAAAAEAKEEAERQLAEARRSQEDAQKLIEANRRVQAADDQLRRTGGDKQLEIALEQLCAGMGEAESLCFHVLERLRKDQNAQPFTAIQNRFRTVLEMNGGKSMVVRLVSATSVANALADLHREIDEVAVNEPNGMWKERWETDRTVMKQKLFDRGFSHMVNDLHEAGAQAEALTLLIHEIKRNKASYSEKELEFLRAVRNYVVSFSALAVPAEEKWLIARHDIQLNDDSFCRGSFGKIYRGKYMNADVVIKCIEIQSDNDRSDFLREVRIWHEVSRHPNITPFFGACHVGLPCFMACKYITDGSLPEYLRSQTEEGCSKVWRALLGVIHGLQFLHSKDIVHGDLKGNNILVEGDTAMLTDFGMSFYRSEERPRFDNVGAIRWRAPEFLTEGPSFEADIYSLGMCIVEATTGNPPWGLLPDVAVAWHLKNGKFLTPPRCMSDNEWALVCGMCELDPAKRISLTDVEKIVTEFAELEEDNERGAWA
ncbi:hypothetical protein PHYBOEH_007613 [Phytophthora boehmeriae]|uniref:Uncharacterized protein n=1 Tax=Phytophthora boehmeriae TaxID=109152 RepID=A0A8T1X1E0_9STRA|nr:hypothetical protein PHYBOEH_007613 [Phytophthora boehmeriae]